MLGKKATANVCGVGRKEGGGHKVQRALKVVLPAAAVRRWFVRGGSSYTLCSCRTPIGGKVGAED